MAIEKTLAEKLKLKPGSKAVVINAPEGYLQQLKVDGLGTEITNQCDWIQIFCSNKNELDELYPQAKAALGPNSLLWVCFLKGQAGKQGGLTRDSGWENANGLKWVTLVSINDLWSAFCFRPLKLGEQPNDWR